MTGEYVIMVDGELITHTQEDHDYMETFNDKLQVLMEIERNASSN
jgi:hypothetical protein